MSGAQSFSQVRRGWSRCLIELTFHVAIRMKNQISQIEKLVPQPQDAVALGLTTRNEAPIRSSTKSTSDPARNGAEAESTSTTALSRAIIRSSSAFARSISNLY